VSRLLSLAVLALLPAALAAQDTAHVACADTALTQASMTRCAGTALRQARDRLDSLITELRSVLAVSERPGLDSTQSLWQAYSVAQCRWEGSAFEGGSMQPMQVAYCRASLTEARIRELAPLLCGLDAQTDCPRASHYITTAPVHEPR
jgi:uncharacterized protein YecT (DUF1311 family)